MNTSQYLLIDLDALLDTRLGCLIQHRPAQAAQMDMVAYRGRFTDNLWTLCDEVTEEQYKSWWANRSVETLQCSTATPMMVRLKAMTYNLMGSKGKLTYMEDLKVYVNTYPYQMDKDVKQAFQDAIKEVVAPDFEVKLVHLHPEVLSPQTLDLHYHYYAVYDLDAWLTYNHKRLEEHPIPAFSMNAPGLFFNHLPDDADIENIGLAQKSEAFVQWELVMCAHLMLGFLPVVEYSQML